LLVLSILLPANSSSGWDITINSEGGKAWIFWIYSEKGSLIDETPLSGIEGTGQGEMHLTGDYKAISLHARSKSPGGDYINATIKENGVVVANKREYVLSKEDSNWNADRDFRLVSPGYEKALDNYTNALKAEQASR